MYKYGFVLIENKSQISKMWLPQPWRLGAHDVRGEDEGDGGTVLMAF